MFHGSITALITPFKNGGLDEQGFQAFVEWQVAEGSNGVVPVGTTGESRRSATTSTGASSSCASRLRPAASR
jgi:dihydrodipicolinate synthase/N-acetylneuraminate lyase